MRSRATRRDALKQILAAGVGITAAPIVLRGQRTPISIAGQPVEIAGLFRNLVPVIAGNLVGGSVIVALVYYVIYVRPRRQQPAAAPAPQR